MGHLQFRAYDWKGKTLVYDKDLWLPQGLVKLGYKEHPVHISQEGIHYTLDCLSNHYENDWEENVIATLDIEVMPCTNLWDSSESPQKMYSHDIISFHPFGRGRIEFSKETGEWIVVDQDGRFIETLNQVEQPRVIGNWFEQPELLG